MGETTLRQALYDYITIYMAYRNFAERTRGEYGNDLEDFTKYCERRGIKQVGKLTLPIIERYIAQLEQRGFTGHTRRRRAVVIRSFLSFLYQDGYVASNLAGRVILPFAESTLPQILTSSECQRLRKACGSNVRDAAIVELLLQTGIRLSELVRLTPDDIDTQTRFLRVLGARGHQARIIPLSERACELASKYLTARGSAQQASLFLNRSGQSLGDRSVQKLLRKYLKSAGLTRASVRTLRHTFGAWHVAQGDRIKSVQELLGHKDRRSTSIYLQCAQRTPA